MTTGTITEITPTGFYAFVEFPPDLLAKREVSEVTVWIDDGRHISTEQRKKAYALIRDIAWSHGYDPEEAKGWLKYDFMAKTGVGYFSLSDVDMTTARYFIDHMVEHCILWDVPCKESLLNRAEDIDKYLYLCLYHRKCCICGGHADVHHAEDRVGMGRNREDIIHLGMRIMPLCRKHHNQCHDQGQEEFNDKWHIYGIAADETLCEKLRLRFE
jgi:hypothetical protein